jgi:hypothetical protein
MTSSSSDRASPIIQAPLARDAMREFWLGYLLTVLLAAVVFITPLKAAEQMTAGELYSFCNSSDQAVKNVCRKYILGAVQGIALATAKANDKRTFCMPDNMEEVQLVAIVQNTMRVDFAAFPQDRNLPAISIIFAAMIRAFPCPNSN